MRGAFCRFTYYALEMEDMMKVRKALFMFVDLFGVERFDYETCVRFFITVKKNYRQVINYVQMTVQQEPF